MRIVKAARLTGFAGLLVGATKIVANRWLQNQVGLKNRGLLLPLLGAADLASGVAILQQPGISQGMATELWARVAGDVVGLAVLTTAAGEAESSEALRDVSAVLLAMTVMDGIVASLLQVEVQKGKAISIAARGRVFTTHAIPNGTLIAEAVQ